MTEDDNIRFLGLGDEQRVTCVARPQRIKENIIAGSYDQALTENSFHRKK